MNKHDIPTHAYGDSSTHQVQAAVPNSDCILVTPILWHFLHFILTG